MSDYYIWIGPGVIRLGRGRRVIPGDKITEAQLPSRTWTALLKSGRVRSISDLTYDDVQSPYMLRSAPVRPESIASKIVRFLRLKK